MTEAAPPRAPGPRHVERRGEPRFEVQIGLSFAAIGWLSLGRRGGGLVVNLSRSGLLVGLATRRLPIRTRVELRLEVDGSRDLCLQGAVVRLTQWGFGVQFESMDEAQRRGLDALIEEAASGAG